MGGGGRITFSLGFVQDCNLQSRRKILSPLFVFRFCFLYLRLVFRYAHAQWRTVIYTHEFCWLESQVVIVKMTRFEHGPGPFASALVVN